jgi:hypothetical protein
VNGHFLGRSYDLGVLVAVNNRGGTIRDRKKCGKSSRDKAVRWRTIASPCFILLLPQAGSHGLDLSFVTHLVLLDKTWDPAVEKQVVARAHRMGATAPVIVEQLLMEGTMEEVLMDFTSEKAKVEEDAVVAALDQDHDSKDPDAASPKKRKRGALGPSHLKAKQQDLAQRQDVAKMHFLLKSLKLLRGNAPPPSARAGAEGDFHPCECFTGPRDGYEFKLSSLGLGYHRSVTA